MKAYWKNAGLSEEGAKTADVILDPMITLVQRIHALGGDQDLMHVVLREALFRVFVLPRRSISFQRKYLHSVYSTAQRER